MRRRLRFLSDAWKALVFVTRIRAAARPCRSRRVPPAAPESVAG
ncbi:hypothetical protein [Caulobacter segnis]|nr:hypothetical protein [Caulobacter segnis]